MVYAAMHVAYLAIVDVLLREGGDPRTHTEGVRDLKVADVEALLIVDRVV